MKKNPVIPFALIAVLGILAMIVLSVVGLDQQEKIANGGEQTAENAEPREPDVIAQSCISCHGTDLSGGVGPSLQQIGSKYTEDEILNIIKSGKGSGMPSMAPSAISIEEAEVLAAWLAEKK